MGKGNSDLWKSLVESPWWAGLLSGVAGYVLLAYLVPRLLLGHSLLEGTADIFPVFAVVWLSICVAASLLGLGRRIFRRRLYDSIGNLRDLEGLSWQQFERLVGEYFRRHGFTVQEVGSTGGDGGVDLLLFRGSERHVVQCKHWKARQVGVGVVRELIGSVNLTGAARGHLVTFGPVTRAARLAAREGDVQILSGADILNASDVVSGDRRHGFVGKLAGFATRWSDRWFLIRAVAIVMLLIVGIVGISHVPGYFASMVETLLPVQERVSSSLGQEQGNEISLPSDYLPSVDESGTVHERGIYRWRDDAGEMHYGDMPPEDAWDVVRLPSDLNERNVIQFPGE